LDFASGAWRQLGAIEGDAFRQLTRELREVAASAPTVRIPGDEPRWTQNASGPSREQLIVGRYAAIYETDHVSGTVLVIDVIRVGSAAAR
jgi:hypothetical protein